MTSEKTFRHYAPAQAKQYAGSRPGYPPELYEHILETHAATGGTFGRVIDVGCGPGRATRDLASAFEHAVGVDPGAEMIRVAREKAAGEETKKGEDIRFEIGEAEKLVGVEGLRTGEAHWFDMKPFWAQAAQLVRPGGTVAIWTKGVPYAHPSMPDAAAVNAIQDRLEAVIAPYQAPGNRVSHAMYDTLELPWAADPAQTAFPEAQFRRFDWDRDGVISDGVDFLGGSREIPLAMYEQMLGTASAVTRWREAHPDLVGMDKDCLKEAVAQMRAALGEKGMRGGAATVLLIFKRAE